MSAPDFENAEKSIDVEASEVSYQCHPGHVFSDGHTSKIIPCACRGTSWSSIVIAWEEAGHCTGTLIIYMG